MGLSKNLNLLWTLQRAFSWLLAPPLIFLVQILRRELEQMTLFSQKYLTVWNYKNDKYSNSHEE